MRSDSTHDFVCGFLAGLSAFALAASIFLTATTASAEVIVVSSRSAPKAVHKPVNPIARLVEIRKAYEVASRPGMACRNGVCTPAAKSKEFVPAGKSSGRRAILPWRR